MGGFAPGEIRRVARLARLDLTPEEADRLGRDLEAITRAFSDLADLAEGLPPAEAVPGPLREDVEEPAPAEEIDGIRAAVPRVDGSGAWRTPRGPP